MTPQSPDGRQHACSASDPAASGSGQLASAHRVGGTGGSVASRGGPSGAPAPPSDDGGVAVDGEQPAYAHEISTPSTGAIRSSVRARAGAIATPRELTPRT